MSGPKFRTFEDKRVAHPDHGVVGGVRLVVGIPVSDDETDFDQKVDQNDGEPQELGF